MDQLESAGDDGDSIAPKLNPITPLAGVNYFEKLPLEVRTKIFENLKARERKRLRLVNSDLSIEIDQCIGCVDKIWLKSKDDTPQEIINFIQSSVFKGLGIKSHVNLTGFLFKDLISYPKLINSITFQRHGKLPAEFCNEMLLQCVNITTLIWKGNILGELPPQGSRTVYLYLKDLQISASYWYQTFFSNQIWKNKLALLDRIYGPKLKDITLELLSFNDRLLTTTVINFLKLHPTIENVLILIRNTERIMGPAAAATLEEFQQQDNPELTPNDKLILQSLGITYLEVVLTSGAVINVERQWIQFMNNLNHVKHLKFHHRSTHPWESYSEDTIYTSNPECLVSLNLSGKFEVGALQLHSVERYISLKVVVLINRSLQSPSPLLQGFGNHTNLIKNLEVLVIQNFRIGIDDLNYIPKLENLKQLSISGIDDLGHYDAFPFYEYQKLLQIRTLESLLIPARVSLGFPQNENDVQYFMDLMSTLVSFITEEQGSRGLLVNISKPSNCPFWSLDEEEDGLIQVGTRHGYVYE